MSQKHSLEIHEDQHLHIGLAGESVTNTVGLHSTNPTLGLFSLFALSQGPRSFTFSSAAWDGIRKTGGKDHTPIGRMLQACQIQSRDYF